MTGKSKPRASQRPADRIGRVAEASLALRDAQSQEDVAAAARDLLAVLGDPTAFVREVERIAQDAATLARRTLLTLEADLRTECAARGWAFDGVWPAFYIEKAVEVAIDEGAGSAKVAGQKVALGVKPIVEAAAPLARNLLPRAFDPRDFLRAVAQAIDAVSGSGSATIGQVYRQLVIDGQSPRFWRDAKAESFAPLTIEQLRARFSRMLEANTALPDGRVLRLSPPLDASEGVFLWQPAERRFAYVGRLQLVPEMRP